MNAVLLGFNASLMIGLPFLLGWLIHRWRSASWRLFVIGAVTFILTQVVHIPFNYVFFSSIFDWLNSLPKITTLVVTAALAGLSAGVFEEGGRYLTYRYWAKEARSWGQGLMLGTGHGGAEAIILGLIVAINITFLFGYRAGFFQSLVPAEQSNQLLGMADQLLTAPWIDSLMGAIERSLALCLHLALSLMVMQVFTRGSLVWLFIAIGWHAVVDAGVIISLDLLGPYFTELNIGVMALISLVVIFALKEPEPEEERPQVLQLEDPAGSIEMTISSEQVDDSRYY
jgi:uncharacterized membrane protein YhfC